MKYELKPVEYFGRFERGRSKHRPRNDKSLYGGIYPFIQTADVGKADYYITEYSQTYNDKGLAQSKLWPAGTLCITIAANIADTAVLSFPACFPDSIIGFSPYPGISNTRYVKACFDTFKQECKQISQGATQDNLSWSKLSQIRFPAPPYEIQCKIASYLSVYDYLVENNQIKIQLLEELMQRHYLAWLNNTTSFVKVRAGDYFDISIGKTPPRSEAKWFVESENSVKWISISDMANTSVFCLDTKETLTKEAIEKFNIRVIPKDTIVVSFKLTVGRVSITTSNMCTNEAIAHFNTDNPYMREYAYNYLKNFRWGSLGSTSSISTAINSKIVKTMDFLVPAENDLRNFSLQQKPIFDEIRLLTLQNKKMIETRDLLMSRIFSGTLEV